MNGQALIIKHRKHPAFHHANGTKWYRENVKFSCGPILEKTVKDPSRLFFIFTIIGLFQFLVMAQYYQKYNLNRFSWKFDDSTKGSIEIFGNHSFSDFTSMLSAAKLMNPWSFDETVTYSPLVMLIYRIIGIFEFSQYFLFLVVVLLSLSSLYPLYSKQLKPLTNRNLYTASVVGSVPFLALVDRGNIIGLLPITLFMFYLKMVSGKNFQAALWLSLSISLKIYPVIFLFFLCLRKQFKITKDAIWLTIFQNLVALVLLGKPLQSGLNFVSNLFFFGRSVPTTSEVIGNVGTRILTLLNEITRLEDHTHLIQYTITLTYIILVSIFIKKSPGNYWFIVALYSLEILPTYSLAYSKVWIFVAIPILFQSIMTQGSPSKTKKTLKVMELHPSEIRFIFIFIFIFCLNLTLFQLNLGHSSILPTISLILFTLLIFDQLASFRKNRHQKLGLKGSNEH